MSPRRSKVPSIQECEAAALELIEDRGWTTSLLSRAGDDPALRRLALAWIVYPAWVRRRWGHPITGPEREILDTLRLKTTFQAHRHRGLLALWDLMIDERVAFLPPSPPKEPTQDQIDARRLWSRFYGRPGPSRRDWSAIVEQAAQASASNLGLTPAAIPALARLALAGLDARTDVEPSSAEREVRRWASAVVAGDAPADPALDDLRLDAAAQAADGVHGLAAIREARRRGLMVDVVDAVRQRIRNTDTNPKEN